MSSLKPKKSRKNLKHFKTSALPNEPMTVTTDPSNYKPITSVINIEELRSLEGYSEKFDVGRSVYFGQLKDKKRNGKGIIVYSNGRIYEGNWKNDARDGEGFEMY